MIPPTLAAFRALMGRVANVRVRRRNDQSDYAQQMAGTSEGYRHALFAQQLGGDQYTTTLSRADVEALRALATATPEQLLGIVFVIRDEYQQDTAAGPVSGYYVTPREDA